MHTQSHTYSQPVWTYSYGNELVNGMGIFDSEHTSTNVCGKYFLDSNLYSNVSIQEIHTISQFILSNALHKITDLAMNCIPPVVNMGNYKCCH